MEYEKCSEGKGKPEMDQSKISLDNIITKMTDDPNTFSSYFCSLECVKRKNHTEIIRNSDIEKSYYYQIIKGNRIPSRNKVLRLCIGAGLSTKETSHALILNGDSPLYLRRKRDRILAYVLEKGFTVTEANLMLDEQGEEML